MDEAKLHERLRELHEWEALYFPEEIRHRKFTNSQDVLPKRYEKKLVELVDRFMFYTQTLILNSSAQVEAEQRILSTAKVFNHRIEHISELDQLSFEQNKFILEQQTAKQRLLSFGQGGLTGLGGPFLLAADLPLMLATNLRTVQLAAMSFGNDLRHPREMMIALKAFHVATLPRKAQYEGWTELQAEKEVWMGRFPVFYGGNEEVTSAEWFQQPLRQIAKLMIISVLRKKMVQGIPIAGIAVGAYSNYQLARQVSTIAGHYYERRYLEEVLQ
ncbi:hypothetical protein DH09_01945 [Bacillaceae bacterium JMAK1]|nr:hypothetical protein DH09_01945 [Bacillaceae bacterium JMAK1]